MTDLWCNGSTSDFGSVSLGSNPGRSTSFVQERVFLKQIAFEAPSLSFARSAALEHLREAHCPAYLDVTTSST